MVFKLRKFYAILKVATDTFYKRGGKVETSAYRVSHTITTFGNFKGQQGVQKAKLGRRSFEQSAFEQIRIEFSSEKLPCLKSQQNLKPFSL
jgi:hypothetical protein